MSNKTIIVAEIGINHNGSIDNCLKMIDSSAEAGCDAVKLQFFKAKYMYPRSAGKLDWKDSEKEYSYDIYKAVESFELPLDWIDELIRYCESKKVNLISSVFDIRGFDLLVDKGIKTIKLASYALTNIPLVEHCAKSRLPLLLSTGGATLGETEEAVAAVLTYHKDITLLHCSIQYPTALVDCNLAVINTLKYAFPGLTVGYSDHTKEIYEAPVQAVYLGATVIEKHITRDKKMKGPDHFFSLEPADLKRMVSHIRQAEIDREKGNFKIEGILYGNSAKICHQNEKYLRDFAFMTLFAAKNIKKGEIIRPENVLILRPGKKKRGLDPKFLSLFQNYSVTAKKNLAFEDSIDWDAIL